MSPSHTTRVWTRRLWPVAVALVVLISSEFIPSVELTRGATSMRKGVEQAQLVCPIASNTGAGRLFITSPSGAVDVHAGMLGQSLRPVRTRLAGLTVPFVRKAGLVTLGDASVGRTDAVVLAKGNTTLVSGLSGQQCQATRTSWWFAGASARFGRSDVLVLTNPGATAAVVDVEAYTSRGREHSATSRGIGVRPRARRIVALSALFPGVPAAVINVSTTSGVIHAALLASQFQATAGSGSEWLPSTQPGFTVVPVAPDLTSATLYLAAQQASTVSVRATGPAGSFTPIGMAKIEVPAGRLVTVRADSVAPDAAALVLSATQPVVAGLVGAGPASARADLIAASGVATTITRGQAITGLKGFASRLVVTSAPGKESVVTISIPRSGSLAPWHRTLTLRDADSRAVWLPVRPEATPVDVQAVRGSVGLLLSVRGAPTRPGTAADITLAARATTVLIRPVVQVPR